MASNSDEPPTDPSTGSNPTVTIVVPFFNPGPVLVSTIERIDAALRTTGLSFELIAVSDGSTDGSAAALSGAFSSRLRVLELDENVGKGAAVRTGLEAGRGRFLGFIDADGDIAPDVLPSFVETAMRTGADICLGSKQHPGSAVAYPPVRRLYSSGYRRLVRLLFHLPVADTQTGIKLYRREVLDAVLPEATQKRFAFDLELFILARRHGFEHFVELPVAVVRPTSSTVSLRSVRSVLLDTLTIYWRFRPSHARLGARGKHRRQHGEADRSAEASRVPDQDIDAGRPLH